MTAPFPGFVTQKIKTSGATIHAVRGGSGPPLLLLHGYPQTHVMWHKIAPRLAQRFTVGRLEPVMDIWRDKAVNVAGKSLPAGHFLPEEVPEETLSAVLDFFS